MVAVGGGGGSGMSWCVNGQEMAEGSDGSGSEMGIEFDGRRNEVWSTMESNSNSHKRKKRNQRVRSNSENTDSSPVMAAE